MITTAAAVQPNWMLFGVVLCTVLLFAAALAMAAYTMYLRLVNQRTAERWRDLERTWEPALAKILSGHYSPGTALNGVRRRDRLRFVDFLLRYATGLPGDDQAILVRTASGFLKDVAHSISYVDNEAYAHSIHALGTLGLETFKAEIVTALDHHSPLVNLVAARALLRSGRRDSIEAVLRRPALFKNWSASFAASMLAAAGPEAVPLLRQILGDTTRPDWLRTAVAEALIDRNDGAAADIAVEVLQEAKDSELVIATLRLLERTGNAGHTPVVRQRCDSPDFAIRANAVSTLAALGSSSDLHQLRRHFDDPSGWVAIRAAWAMKEQSGDEVLRNLATSHHPRANLALQVLSEQTS